VGQCKKEFRIDLNANPKQARREAIEKQNPKKIPCSQEG
jgi:hypothetical protein